VEEEEEDLEEEDTSDVSYNEEEGGGGGEGSEVTSTAQLRTYFIPPQAPTTTTTTTLHETNTLKQLQVYPQLPLPPEPFYSTSPGPFLGNLTVTTPKFNPDEVFEAIPHSVGVIPPQEFPEISASASAHKIGFLLQDSESFGNIPGKEIEEEKNITHVMEEVQTLREELKQTKLDLIRKITDIQKQIQMVLFLVNNIITPVPEVKTNEAIAVWDPNTLKLISSNSFFEQFLKCSKEDLKDIVFWRLFPDFFIPVAREFFKTITENIRLGHTKSVTQVMAFCITNKVEDVQYAQVNCEPSFKKDQIEIIMYIKPLLN